MIKMKRWISGVFRSHKKTNKDLEATESVSRQLDVLALPSPRKHVLTRRSSFEKTPRLDSLFFERLPREVRDQIYIAAFGGRTLHMDRQWNRPLVPHESSQFIHANLTNDMERDQNVRYEWAWWSSVCHRHPVAEPWDDKCTSGSSRKLCNHFYPRDDCFLGVMGWLLSCRQA